MSPLTQEVLFLLQSSPALWNQPELLNFWIEQIPKLKDDGLLKLKAILEEDRRKCVEIAETSQGRVIEIEKQHLEALEHFNRVDLPKFLKVWEQMQAEKNPPEDLLKQL